MYLKIHHDDSIFPWFEELDLPEDVTEWLHAVHAAIGCSTIQIVPTVVRGIVLVIDDDGKLRDGWERRFNKIATILYGNYADGIVGDAILARVQGEDLVPLTSADVDFLRRNLG